MEPRKNTATFRLGPLLTYESKTKIQFADGFVLRQSESVTHRDYLMRIAFVTG